MDGMLFASALDSDDSNWFWESYLRHLSNDQRIGQAIFNAAADTFPIQVNVLRGSSKDCFYRDENVPAFLLALLDILTDPKGN